eukprot:88551-Hanusia_phi.AAC.1
MHINTDGSESTLLSIYEFVTSSANLTLWGEVNLDVPQCSRLVPRPRFATIVAPTLSQCAGSSKGVSPRGHLNRSDLGLHEDLLRFLSVVPAADPSHRSTCNTVTGAVS